MQPTPVVRAQYEQFSRRERTGTHEVRPGIWSAAVPYRFGVPYSLTYLLRDDDGGFLIVDPGADLPGNREILTQALAAAGARPHDVRAVAATHMHHDHLGMAAWLSRESGCAVLLHDADIEALRSGAADSRYSFDIEALGARWGVPSASLSRLVPHDYRAPVTEVPDRLAPLSGETSALLAAFGVTGLSSPGHTRGHTCFVVDDANLVLTGDTAMPHLHTPLGRDTASEHTAVADFLASMSALAPFDACDVGPGHGYCFRDLGARRRDLTEHVLRRVAEVSDAVARGAGSTWQVAERVTWGPGWDNLSGAMLQSALAQTALYVSYVHAADGTDHPA